MVTIENYEEYMMLDADGELDSAGQQALQDFLTANPSLKDELAIWTSLKLQPDEAMVFPEKSALRKSGPRSMTLAFRPYVLAAAAAVLGVIFSIFFLWKSEHPEKDIVQKVSPTNAFPPPIDIIRDSGLAQAAPVANANPAPTARKSNHPTKGATLASSSNEVKGDHSRGTLESIAKLDAGSVRMLPQMSPSLPEAPQAREMIVATVPGIATPKTSGLPRITLAAENKAAFEQLKGAFEARLAQASAAARSVKETALEIKIGDGSVNLHF